jgi:hypothetical protein
VGTYLAAFSFILFYFILLYCMFWRVLATWRPKNICSATHKKKDQTFVVGKNCQKSPDFEDSLENLPYLENQF